VIAAELIGPGDSSLLLPAEAECLGRAVRKRVQEFAAGRLCARRALAEFGVSGFPVRSAKDRQPIWPDRLVGSITHTDGYCAAVVAERGRFLGIGVDTEAIGRVTRELWRQVFLAEEIDWLESLQEPQRAVSATTLFAAKEAFYKCQYPLTLEWLNFEDVRVEIAACGPEGGKLIMAPTRPLALLRTHGPSSDSAKLPCGRYRVHAGLVTVGMSLPVPQ
jgi:4'-phosphopantetheinyl transferase EntD